MRRIAIGAALVGLAAALAACAPGYPGPGGPGVHVARVDPEDAADRALWGSALGAAMGAGVGATVAINPGLGALIGTEIGAPIGAVLGVATAQPLPDYKPIPITAAAVIPHYYDTWPPGYHLPPIAAGTPPPPR